MSEHVLFESIEGLAGTGKTTVAPLLAQARQAVLVATVPANFQSLRRKLDKSSNADARMCLFLSALLTATDQIVRYLEAGVPVVVESYFARCITTHREYGATLGIVLPAELPEPVTYQLTCAPHERLRRLAHRDKAVTKWDILAEQHSESLTAAIGEWATHRIDTTASAPADVVRTILSLNRNGSEDATR
ncbi:AAA family ATPase [Nocardia sp. NPDC050718]|uniref:AAA family ATPase n=1 Tax=unclassified Nocardia TaxID=2637762 RepID=UPI0033F34DF9